MSARDRELPIGPELERRLRESVARAPASDSTAPTPEELRAALSGELSEEERLRTLDLALQSEQGRRELATLRLALDAAERSWPEGATDRWRRRSTLAAAAMLFIAVAAGSGVWLRARSSDGAAEDGALRSEPPQGATASIELAPADVVAPMNDSIRVVWRSVAGALRYDVELLGDDGRLLWSGQTGDTTTMIPSSTIGGATRAWWVRGALPGGGEIRSRSGRITVR